MQFLIVSLVILEPIWEFRIVGCVVTGARGVSVTSESVESGVWVVNGVGVVGSGDVVKVDRPKGTKVISAIALITLASLTKLTKKSFEAASPIS